MAYQVNQAVINKAKDEYNAAKSRGDKAGMEAAHAKAEAERARAGYSGGVDGSQKIYTPTPSTKSNTKTSKTSSVNTSANTNPITTNHSYNGNYLTIDPNVDYQSKINNAIAIGNYDEAAYNEALRNAKLTYLNKPDEATYNYIQKYNQSKGTGGAGTNNLGGTVYTNSAKSLSDLPDNWTSASVNGVNYTRDSNGNINSVVGKFFDGTPNVQTVGNGINSVTGEFTLDKDMARKVAYDRYIGSGNLNDYNTSGQDAYKYIQDRDLVNESYIDALMKGEAGNWTNQATKYARDKQELDRLIANLNLPEDYNSVKSYEDDLAKYTSLANQMNKDNEAYGLGFDDVVTSAVQERAAKNKLSIKEQLAYDENSFETDYDEFGYDEDYDDEDAYYVLGTENMRNPNFDAFNKAYNNRNVSFLNRYF